MAGAVCIHMQGSIQNPPSCYISWYSTINTVPVHPFIAFFIYDGIYNHIKIIVVSNLNVLGLKTFIMQTHHWSQFFKTLFCAHFAIEQLMFYVIYVRLMFQNENNNISK